MPSIPAHNDLCALVEKGRKYDIKHDLEQAQIAINRTLLSQRDEAVRLLKATGGGE